MFSSQQMITGGPTNTRVLAEPLSDRILLTCHLTLLDRYFHPYSDEEREVQGSGSCPQSCRQ